MHHTALFQPLQAGALTLPNRIVMAPLTRARTVQDHLPTALMAAYYAQRASGGLIIAEATMAMAGNSAFWMEPGIHSPAQIAGWKTRHRRRTRRRRSDLSADLAWRARLPSAAQRRHPAGRPQRDCHHRRRGTDAGGQEALRAAPRTGRRRTPGHRRRLPRAAENAQAAGFDGVEVHGANGYLVDEFLRDGANKRLGPYGGSVENRARLLLEVIAAVSEIWGSDRVGLRISPLNSYNSMIDSDPIGLVSYLATELDRRGLAYLHVMRGDFFQQQTGDVLTPIRERFHGTLVANMGYSAAEAAADIAAGKIDAVAFGVPFLANPDLPERFAQDAPLNAPDPATFYGGGAKGYTDYPTLAEVKSDIAS
jgi:N-ethylmaleimide reductase